MTRSTSTALVPVKSTDLVIVKSHALAVIKSVRSWRWLMAAVCAAGFLVAAGCAPLPWKNTDGHYTPQAPIGIR